MLFALSCIHADGVNGRLNKPAGFDAADPGIKDVTKKTKLAGQVRSECVSVLQGYGDWYACPVLQPQNEGSMQRGL